MIDLTQTRTIINDAWEILEDLDGLDLDDGDGIVENRNNSAAKQARIERAQTSRDLLMLADRLAAAEATVRQTYWKFKGGESAFDIATEARAL